MADVPGTGKLADPALLEAIDKLFELNICEYGALPQLLVIGDQSSGKSSVLEGLTGNPYPRASTLCTRFATQITFRRAPVQKTAVSVIPAANTQPEYAEKLRKWKKDDLQESNSQAFEEILREVRFSFSFKLIRCYPISQRTSKFKAVQNSHANREMEHCTS